MARISFDLGTAREFPEFKIYHRAATNLPWLALRMFANYDQNGGPDGNARVTDPRPGALLRSMSRVLIPGIGEAVFYLHAGLISGRQFQTGDDWDLFGHQIRIDTLPDGGDASSADAYRTVWWGICTRQTDHVDGAAVTDYGGSDDTFSSAGSNYYPMLRRTYYCLDLSYQLTKRYIDRHFYDPGEGAAFQCSTPPAGFNVGVDPSSLAANRSSGVEFQVADGVAVPCHIFPGAYNADVWTDREVLQNILGMHQGSTGASDQPLSVTAAAGLLASVSAWPVPQGTTVHQLLAAICARQRGLGAAFIDWDDTQLTATSEAFVKVVPQLAETLVVQPISDSASTSTTTITGATTAGTTQDIVIAGDHRLDDESFSVGDASELRYDEVETIGERIQVLVSIGKPDESLEQGWTLVEETAWEAASSDAKDRQTFDAIYRRFQLPANWNCTTAGAVADTTPLLRCDYRTRADGTIEAPAANSTSEARDTNPGDIRLQSFLPCPLSIDPATGLETDQSRNSGLHSWRVWERTASNAVETYDLPANSYTARFGLTDIELAPSSEEGGTRASADFWESLIWTVGIELPHRVRMHTLRDGLAGQPKSKVLKRVPDANLWLGHREAIIDIDTGSTPRRVQALSPLIYRDDRKQLQLVHALAVEWYTKERRPATWTLRHCCGLLPEFTDSQGTQEYAQLGQVITTLTYAGEAVSLNTVVSGIVYNDGRTTWQTDWANLS